MAKKERIASEQSRSILIPFLTVLLVLLGVSEAGFWSYYGFSTYRQSQAQIAYEERQKEEQPAQAVRAGSSLGPNVMVLNGEITWQSDLWLANGGTPNVGVEVSSPPDQAQDPAPASPDSTAPDVPSAQPQPSEPAPAGSQSGGQTTAPVQKQPTAQTPSKNTGTPSSGTVTFPSKQTQTTTPSNGTQSSGNGSGWDTGTYDRQDWPKGKLLGSKDSNKYHNKNCKTGAARIKPVNEIWFNSVAEAEAAGYIPCGNCYR